MKAYVSIDLEGLPGISSLSQVSPGLSLYGDARRIMTWVANRFVHALTENGFDEIMIADSHGFMNNIEYLEVEGPVKIMQGYPRPFSMVIGVEESDAALFIGYHSAAGTLGGFLDHTYSSKTIQRIYVNNRIASEYYLNALYAGAYNVPVILVAGDHYLRENVNSSSPGTVFLELKKGISRNAASYHSRHKVEEMIGEAVSEAARRFKAGRISPLKIKGSISLKIELRGTIYADMAQQIPGARRTGAYTIEYEARDPVDALRFVELVAWVGAGAAYLVQASYK